jgi:O-antigen ligase
MLTATRKFLSEINQYLLVVIVSLLLGGVSIIDIEFKWKFAFIVGMGVAVLLLSTNPKHTLLFLASATVPFLLSKALVGVSSSKFCCEIDGIGIKQNDVIAVALLLFFLVPKALEKTKISFFPSITIPALAWILASALSLLNAPNLLAGIAMLIFMVQQFIVYLILANSLTEKRDMEWIMGGIILGIFFQAMLGIYQGVVGHPVGLSFLGETSRIAQQELGQAAFNRVQGTLSHPNSFSMYLTTGLPFLLAWFFISKNKITRLLCGAIFFVGTIGIILSLSRSGWIVLLILCVLGLMAAVYLKKIKMGSAVALLLLASVAMAGLVFFGPDIILLRLTSSDSGSARSRITLAQVALRVIMDHPFLGTGLNNYISAMLHYAPYNIDTTGNPTLVHNVYLLITAETGLLGGITFISLLAAALINCWQVFIRSKDDSISALSIGLFSAITGIAIHGLVDYDLIGDGRATSQFWLLLAMVAAIVQYQKRNATLLK